MSRSGDWIATYSGVKWFLTDPHPDDVRIEDIAHALGMICRYGGHCRDFYSVAQHSVLVSEAVEREHPGEYGLILHGLLHDAPEAYVGDMVSPLKRQMPHYKALEHLTEGVIAVALGLPVLTQEQRAIIKHFDDVLLMTERRDLVNHCGHEWTPRAEPLPCTVAPHPPAEARYRFLDRYLSLKQRYQSSLAPIA